MREPTWVAGVSPASVASGTELVVAPNSPPLKGVAVKMYCKKSNRHREDDTHVLQTDLSASAARCQLLAGLQLVPTSHTQAATPNNSGAPG